jgi:hypothetical protein
MIDKSLPELKALEAGMFIFSSGSTPLGNEFEQYSNGWGWKKMSTFVSVSSM